eukprot:TRINITY_DN92972_c0_g1_i1.p1 TRINITY_DN92972_c0_g1~~TRINITY_DN92972_c0_g1_i1.p1  ORF type:complete len:484 (+),score=104.76 TRINITY_DN92972_c0_g1_i1:98-1549(+)
MASTTTTPAAAAAANKWHDVQFFTARESKVEEVRPYLFGLHLHQNRTKLFKTLERVPLTEVAAFRAQEAYNLYNNDKDRVRGEGGPKHACMVEEVAIYVGPKFYSPGRYWAELVERDMEHWATENAGKEVRCEVAVAFAEPQAEGGEPNLAVFSGKMRGTIVWPPRGTHGTGWDSVVQVLGCDQTLAEMDAARNLVNFRHMAYQGLMHWLHRDQVEYPGVYELHLTVPYDPSPEYREKFFAVCAEVGVKPLEIVFESTPGMTPQYQTAVYRSPKSSEEAIDMVQEQAKRFVERGVAVTRMKVEAMFGNRVVPQTDADARAPGLEHSYFEFHMKPKLAPEEWTPEACQRFLEVLQRFCRVDTDGSPVYAALSAGVNGGRAISFRTWRRGAVRAKAVFYRLIDALTEAGFPPKKKPLHEFALYESDSEMDMPWLRPGNTKPLERWDDAASLDKELFADEEQPTDERSRFFNSTIGTLKYWLWHVR